MTDVMEMCYIKQINHEGWIDFFFIIRVSAFLCSVLKIRPGFSYAEFSCFGFADIPAMGCF
jgi:hypothetical protein